MNNFWLKFRNWVLLGGDFFIFYISLWLTLLIRYQEQYASWWQIHVKPFTVLFLIWIIIFYIANLYDLRRAENKSRFYLHLLSILLFCAVLGMGFFYLLPNIGISPKTNLILNTLIASILIFVWRLFFNKIVSSPNRKVIFIGNNEQLDDITEAIKQHPQWGYQMVAVFSAEQIYDIKQMIKKDPVVLLVVSNDLYQTQELTNALYESLSEKIDIMTLTRFYETLLKKIPLTIISKIWFLENLAESKKYTVDHIKRILDIIISFFTLLITMPFYPFIIILIKLDSKGPAFYTQIRTGRLGSEYSIVKFRTMHKQAESNGPEWAKPDDPRVTKVGKWMRKIRLDELPQLFNVLWGEMSLVGPRPERPEFIEQLEKEIPYYKQRLLAKPGITGWAQVNYKYSSDIAGTLEKLQFDLYYVKNRSIFLDFTIMLKTIRIILSGGGH